MDHEVAEATRNINGAFGLDTVDERSVQRWKKISIKLDIGQLGGSNSSTRLCSTTRRTINAVKLNELG